MSNGSAVRMLTNRHTDRPDRFYTLDRWCGREWYILPPGLSKLQHIRIVGIKPLRYISTHRLLEQHHKVDYSLCQFLNSLVCWMLGKNTSKSWNCERSSLDYIIGALVQAVTTPVQIVLYHCSNLSFLCQSKLLTGHFLHIVMRKIKVYFLYQIVMWFCFIGHTVIREYYQCMECHSGNCDGPYVTYWLETNQFFYLKCYEIGIKI